VTKPKGSKTTEASLRDLVLEATAVELGADGEPPKRIRIASFGENPTTKGAFKLERKDAEAMVKRAAARGIKQHADYEHASVHAAAKGTPAPASAWYDLELGQDGLYASNIEWTKPALSRLKEREYRYISPWFGQREDGTVATFKNFALTNRPAMDNLAPLVASDDDAVNAPPPETPKMKTLFKQLALSEEATEAEVMQAVTTISKERDAFYTATGTKDLPSALAAFETARAGAAKAAKLEEELKGLKAGAEKKERELVLNAAVEAGQIPPNMKDFWASDSMSLEQLKAYVEKAPKAAGKSKVAPSEKDTREIDLALTDEERAVAKTMNIPEAELEKHKKQMAGRV
jgi:phage I-like protein